MNNKNRSLLCSALLGFLLNNSALHASSDTSQQTLRIFVPKVALIELEQTEQTFVFSGNAKTLRHTSKVALSSNDRNAHIKVQVNGLPANLKLDITANAQVCADSAMQRGHTFSCRVGMNATRDGELVLTASRNNQQSLPDGEYTANITYTLSD